MADAGGGPPTAGLGRGLAAALLTASLMPLNSTMVAVAVPAIGREIGEQPEQVTQALVATYLIAAIALQSPGGKLGDRFGHRRLLAVGQVTIAVGALLGFLAPGLVALATSRVLMATGGALAVPATVALLRLELPPERRGRAFGTFGAAMALAAALGPVVGGVLVDELGWRSVFVVNLPVLCASVLLALGVPRSPAPAQPVGFDWPGSVLLATGLALVVLAAEDTGRTALVLLGAGAVALAGLVVRERCAADPVVDVELFRTGPFAAGTVLIAVQNLAMYALLFEVPLLLERLHGVDAGATGRILVFLMAAMVLTSLAAGRLTDRWGARPVAIVGSLACLAAIGLLAATDWRAADDVRWPLALLGVGLGLSGPAAQAASLSAVAGPRSGMAAGVSSTMRYLGGVAGIALLGLLLDLSGDRAEVLHEHHVVLAVFAGALTVGLGCALLLTGRATARPVDVRAAEG